MKRVLIDTNVCIDFILRRIPNFADAKIVIDEITKGNAQGCITASMATDIFYLVQKANSKAFALNALIDILLILEVLNVYKEDVHSALQSGWNDFEDALQATVAEQSGIDAIVTRNCRDYRNAQNIDIVHPQDFIRYLED